MKLKNPTKVTVTLSVVQQHTVEVDVEDDFSQVNWDFVIAEAMETTTGDVIECVIKDKTNKEIVYCNDP